MRFIGKWLIWIGGLALLYRDLRPMVEEYIDAQKRGEGLGPYTVEEWLMRFAGTIFVLGVICAAALPDLDRRKARKKAAHSAPIAPSVATPAPPAAPASSAPNSATPPPADAPPASADGTPPAAL